MQTGNSRPAKASSAVRSTGKASQTILKRRNGRLMSQQNNNQIGGRQRPPPMASISLDDPPTNDPAHSPSFETSFISSPSYETASFMNEVSDVPDNHFDHYLNADSGRDPDSNAAKKIKVRFLNFSIALKLMEGCRCQQPTTGLAIDNSI